MAKRKLTKKVENIEKEAIEEVFNEAPEINKEEVNEVLNDTVNENINMDEVSEFIGKEEAPKNEKTNSISHKLNEMFGFIWNGQEYDF